MNRFTNRMTHKDRLSAVCAVVRAVELRLSLSLRLTVEGGCH